MRRSLLTVGLAGAITATAYAATSTNGYTVIPERNSFGLKEPKPFEAPPPTPQPAALPKLTLTGITTILGTKQALFKVVPPPRPGEAQKEESYILAEGQKEGILEVVAIDEDQGRVRVKNSGTLVVLDIDRDGPKPATAGTNLTMQVAGAPLYGANTSAVPALSPTGVRSNPYYRGYGSALTNLGQYAASASQSVPYTVTNQNQVIMPPPLPPIIVDQRLSPEEQAVLSEVQREINSRQNTSGEVTRGNLPVTGTGSALLPPTYPSGTTGAMPRPSTGVPLTELGADSPLPGAGVPLPPPMPSPSQRQIR